MTIPKIVILGGYGTFGSLIAEQLARPDAQVIIAGRDASKGQPFAASLQSAFVRCDAGNRPMVVELNPLPGILPDPRDKSCFPKAARAAGMGYDELIRTVADIAWRRISGRSLLAEVA